MDLEQELKVRHELAEQLFPLPPKEGEAKTSLIDTTKSDDYEQDTLDFM